MAKNSIAAVSSRRESLLRFLALNQNSMLIDIASEFGTSEMTIRRDLYALSEDGLISKGVDNRYSLNCDPAFDPQFFFRYSTNHRKKLAVAEEAAKLISSGDFVFLDSGTTVLELSKKLMHLDNIKIVTNNLYIPMYISQNPGTIDTELLGGPVDWPSMSTNSDAACKKLEEYRADCVFFSADGVDPVHGVTIKETQLTHIKSIMLKQAEKKVLLADSSKLGCCSGRELMSLSDVDVLVTDWDITDVMLQQLQGYVGEIIVATLT